MNFTGGRSLRWKLLLAHLVVIASGVLTLLVATVVLAPRLFNRLLLGMMGPNVGTMNGMMGGMATTVTQAFRAAMFEALLFSAGVAILAAIATSLFVSDRIVARLRRLLAASRRVAAGHYAERVPADGTDELGALAAEFNTMAQALEGAERRRVALIGDVAHELRTPLATIEGYTEGLLDGMVTPGAATWAVLQEEAARLRRLVDDLQALSRAEARQEPLHPRPIAPLLLVTQALDRMEPQFADKHIMVTHAVPADLPLVQADPDRVMQVLINVLGNALHYTPPEGTVEVGAERREQAVVFHVTDTGMGIATEHLPYVFERFYRVDKARSRTMGGSGIGLAIVQALILAHGGVVWAESPGVGRGTTFSFTLPVAG